MPSVRDLLAAAGQGGQQGDQLGVDAGENLTLKEGKASEKLGESDLADRIRQAAQRRVDLARQEVEKRQEEVRHLEERLAEAAKHELPQAEIEADMTDAQFRLSEARSDLVRAEEAQLNTDLAAELKLNETAKGETQDTQKKPSVRDQLKGFFSRKDTAQGNSESVVGPKPKL